MKQKHFDSKSSVLAQYHEKSDQRALEPNWGPKLGVYDEERIHLVNLSLGKSGEQGGGTGPEVEKPLGHLVELKKAGIFSKSLREDL